MSEKLCVVFPHAAEQHVMAESAQRWKGDYCTVCHQYCKARR